MNFSFEDLKLALVKEKSSPGLAELPQDFYPLAANHVAELKRELGLSEGVRKELLQAELEQSIDVLRELCSLRVVKALEEVARGRAPENLLEREREAFDRVARALEELREQLVGRALEELPAPKEVTGALVVVLQDLPEVLGDDLRRYGPFKQGDLAFLPPKCAGLLVKQGVAKRVEVKA